MTQCIRKGLFAGVLLIHSFFLFAQPGIIMPVINEAQPNTVLLAPVKVINWDSIVSAQFVIRWDSTVLDYLTIGNYNLPDLDNNNIGNLDVDSGFLTVAWWAESDGESVPDSTTIFNLKFKVIGECDSSSDLSVIETPPLVFFEIADGYGTFFDLDTTQIFNGSVNVCYTVSAESPLVFDGLSAYVAPNPLSDDSKLFVEADRPLDLQYSLVNAAGQVLDRQRISLPSGKHGMEIAKTYNERPGPLYLVLQTEKTTRVIPLLVF